MQLFNAHLSVKMKTVHKRGRLVYNLQSLKITPPQPYDDVNSGKNLERPHLHPIHGSAGPGVYQSGL